MRSSILRPTGWLFYRACVALRQILKAWKKPAVRRVRKAALIATLCVLATRQRACLGDGIHVRASNSPSPSGSNELRDDGIRPIHQLAASIAPSAGELPTDFAALRFAQVSAMNDAATVGRGWAAYVYFWRAPAICCPSLCFAPLVRLYALHDTCGKRAHVTRGLPE